MEVEGAVLGHLPHHGGQHPECHHDKEVGLVGCQGLQKLQVFQLLGLKQWETMLHGSLLDLGILYLSATTSRLVGHGDHGGYFIASRKDGFELRSGKLWRAEINDSNLVHVLEGIKKLAQRWTSFKEVFV